MRSVPEQLRSLSFGHLRDPGHGRFPGAQSGEADLARHGFRVTGDGVAVRAGERATQQFEDSLLDKGRDGVLETTIGGQAFFIVVRPP